MKNARYNYTWTQEKFDLNRAKHRLDFHDAIFAFEGDHPFVSRFQERKGEDRWVGLGIIRQKTVFIVYQENTAAKRRHIISMRTATAKERKEYEREAVRDMGRISGVMEILDAIFTEDP